MGRGTIHLDHAARAHVTGRKLTVDQGANRSEGQDERHRHRFQAQRRSLPRDGGAIRELSAIRPDAQHEPLAGKLRQRRRAQARVDDIGPDARELRTLGHVCGLIHDAGIERVAQVIATVVRFDSRDRHRDLELRSGAEGVREEVALQGDGSGPVSLSEILHCRVHRRLCRRSVVARLDACARCRGAGDQDDEQDETSREMHADL